MKGVRQELKSEQRDLERELRGLERAEKQAVAQAREAAKKGDEKGARVLAKEVVRIRNAMDRLQGAKTQLSSVSLRTHEVGATMAMARSMQTAGKAMHVANQQLSVQQMNAVMREFEKQSAGADMRTEMLDDLFQDDEMEQEADAAVMQIFDELGVEATQKMPAGRIANADAAEQDEDKQADEILRRRIEMTVEGERVYVCVGVFE